VSPVRTPREREGLHQLGRDYADAVQRFMESIGYMMTGRAELHGSLEDLHFRRKATGDEKVIAEAKNSKSLNRLQFADGIARYFLHYMDTERGDRPKFFIFARRLEGRKDWKSIFNPPIEGDKAVAEYYEELNDPDRVDEDTLERLERFDLDDFYEFVIDTDIWEYSYLELETASDRNERSELFDYEPYLHKYEAISEPGGYEYTANLFEVTNVPETLYKIRAVEGTESKKYYTYNSQYYPLLAYGDYLYSLVEPSSLPARTQEYIHQQEGDVEELDFETWIESEDSINHDNRVKTLLRGLITLVAQQTDCEVHRTNGRTIIFMPYDSGVHGGRRKYDGIWVAKELDRGVVIHRGIELNVENFGGKFYYSIKPTKEFTTNGKRRISGDWKKSLSSDFSDSRFHQNRRKFRQVMMWRKKLIPGESLDQYEEALPAVLELRIQQVDNLKLPVRPPKDGEERDEKVLNPVVDREEDDE
jgi:hypothetical protein